VGGQSKRPPPASARNASGSVTSTSLSPSLLSVVGQREMLFRGQAAAAGPRLDLPAMLATDRCVANPFSLSLSRGTVHVQKPWTETVTPRLGSAPIIKDGGCVVRGLLQTSARTSRGPHAGQRVLYLNSRGIVAMRRGGNSRRVDDGIYSVVAAEAYHAVRRRSVMVVVPPMALVWCGGGACLPARAAPTRTLSLLILSSVARCRSCRCVA
jgi:hypothetical protein